MATFGTRDVRLMTPADSTCGASFPPSVASNTGTGFLSVVEEATGLIVMAGGFKVENYPPLREVLLAQLKVSRAGVLAITYLDTEEYGSGQTEDQAVADLISSLAEYKDSLEQREDRLSEEAMADLSKLRRLFDMG